MVPAMKKWLSWTRKNVLVKHLLHIKLLCSGRVGYAVVGLSYEFSLSLRLGGRTNNPRVRVTVGGGMANAPQIKKLIKKITLEVLLFLPAPSHNSSQDNYTCGKIYSHP